MMRSSVGAAAVHVVVLSPLRDERQQVTDARIDFADDVWRSAHTSGADPTGHSLRRYLGDDSSVFDAVARASRGEHVVGEFRHPRAPERVAEVHLTPTGDRILVMGREITHERALDDELERSRAELFAAQKVAQMGSWSWDPRTDRAEWSDTMLAIYGLPPKTPTPSFAEQARFYDPETVARTNALIERVVRTGEPYSMEYDLTRADGQRRRVIAHGESIVLDGVFAGLRGTVIDITALHETREALARAERRFSTVLDVVQESVVILHPKRDAAGDVTALYIEWVNPAWHELWGLDKPVIGLDGLELLPVFRPFRALLRELLEDGEPRELSLQLPDGRQVEVTLVAMGDRLVGVGRDVTAARRAQHQLEEHKRVEQLVTLATGVAHQFNNLLAVIVGHAELLAGTAGDDDQVDVRAILNATRRAATLTSHLLAYAERQPLHPRRFELAPFVERVLPALRVAGGPFVEVAFEDCADGAWVRFDRHQLELTLLELVRNARRAMPTGGRIQLTTRASSPMVLLAVADTGNGISPQDLERIFDPFFASGRFGESTGLGLSSVYGTMRQSGGRVTVDSAPGGGSVFTLHLPEAQAPDETPTTRPIAPAPRQSALLVVDGEDAIRQVIARLLRRRGYAVLQAKTGPEALTVLSETEVDLLLTDVHVAPMTGRELAERALAHQPSLGVVFMSGTPAADLEAEGALPPEAPFLAKPFDGSDLLEVLEQAQRSRPPTVH
ncbi:MAG: ATP-binding protein [Polyangiaceae bacterium]